MKKKSKVLFVCRYNHFRSAVSEQILKNIRKDLIVDSAGIDVKSRNRVPARAWKPAQKCSVNIKNHTTKSFTKYKAKRFDKIYVFEKEQKNLIEKKFPIARGKVSVIKSNEDLKGKSFEKQKKFVDGIRIILKKLANEL